MYKVLWHLCKISPSYKVTKFWIQRKWCYSRESIKISLHIFVSFMEKKAPIKFHIFDHFSKAYKVVKFWMIELYLNVIDIIHLNRQTKHANCDLHVNFCNFLWMPFCFMMKKDHFIRKMVLWPQVPFKDNDLDVAIIYELVQLNNKHQQSQAVTLLLVLN